MNGASRIMAHMVACFPDEKASLQAARGLVDGGAAYLEVQFPFSDPNADGPDIQRACCAALKAGFTVDGGFRLLDAITRAAEVPVFVMSYANLLFSRGIEAFLARCRECRVHGVIVPDLPPDYDERLFALASGMGIEAVPLASPSTKDERLARIARMGSRYVYATLRVGITGARTRIDEASLLFLKRIAEHAGERPVSILGGFGIASRAQVAAVEPFVHAVVAGSVFVREIAAEADPYRACREKAAELLTDRPG